MPVYLAPVLCVDSTSLTPSCNLALIVDEFSSLPILSKIMRSTMSRESAGHTETDECKPRAGSTRLCRLASVRSSASRTAFGLTDPEKDF